MIKERFVSAILGAIGGALAAAFTDLVTVKERLGSIEGQLATLSTQVQALLEHVLNSGG